jgi:hypothetical protein
VGSTPIARCTFCCLACRCVVLGRALDVFAAAMATAAKDTMGVSASEMGVSLPALAMFAVKMLAKGVEASAKEYSELVGPCRNILQRFGVQPVQSVATIAAY